MSDQEITSPDNINTTSSRQAITTNKEYQLKDY